MAKEKQTEQSKRFVEQARKMGLDESEEAFERQLEKLASARPTKDKPAKKKPD